MTKSHQRWISSGLGLNSQAMLEGALDRGIEIDGIAVCDVGDVDALDPAEWPSSWHHFDTVIRPLCEAHGIEVVVIDTEKYPIRGERSLFEYMRSKRQIPVAGPDRNCTLMSKVERFEAWMADRFGPGTEVEVWIGFDAGETWRVEKDPHAGSPAELDSGVIRRNRFPLIEWGWCRCRCEESALRWGHPVARKSGCTFCPFAQRADWARLRAELPGRFEQIARLELDKPPTRKGGVKMSIMSFRKWKFEQAHAEVLAFARDGDLEALPGARRRSLAVCKARGWVAPDGRLTRYGRDILDQVKVGEKIADALPRDARKLQAGLRSEVKTLNAQLRRLRARKRQTEETVDTIRGLGQQLVQAEGQLELTEEYVASYLVPGTHYQSVPLAEWVDGWDGSDETSACAVCGRQQRATKRTGCTFVQEHELVARDEVN